MAYRRVLNAVEDALQAQMQLEMIKSFRRWGPTVQSPYVAGNIFEADARAIERRLNFAVQAAVVTPRYVSSASVKLSRTPTPISGGKFKLTATGKITAPRLCVRVRGRRGDHRPGPRCRAQQASEG